MKNGLNNCTNKKLILMLISSFIVGIVISYFAYTSMQKVLDWSNSIFTNPALNYTELKGSIMSDKNINLWNQINAYISSKKSLWDITHLSVYYRNLNNWWWFGINEKEEFSPASLMKLPILLAYMKNAEKQPWMLDQKVTYHKTQNASNYRQNIPPEEQLKDWIEYTLWQVLQYMIIYSDNNASSFLEQNLPIEDLQKTFTDVGIQFPEFKNWSFDNNVKVIDYASFFRVLFNSSYLTRQDSEKALNLLNQIKFKNWLVAWVPESINVSHKFGERGIIWSNGREEKQLHDCGIVYYPNHPYLLCVMTRWFDRTKLESVIADISKMVYSETQAKYWNDPLDISTDSTN